MSQRLLHDRATIDDVAREEGLTASYVTRLLRINFLAPDITAGCSQAGTIPICRPAS